MHHRLSAFLAFASLTLAAPLARAEFYDDAGNLCDSLNACECSGACAAVCGDNDCAGAGFVAAECRSCLTSANPGGCLDEVNACYPPAPPPPPCDPALPLCGASVGCSDGSNPDADPTCADQGLPGACLPCCYVVDPSNPYSAEFNAAGCL